MIENYLETIEEVCENNPYEELTDEDLREELVLDFAGENINSIHKELEQRGLTEEDIKKGKQKLSDTLFRPNRADYFTFFIGFMGALGLGIGGITTGVKLYYGKNKNLITGEEYYKYDSLSRDLGLLMIFIGSFFLLIVLALIVIVLYL